MVQPSETVVIEDSTGGIGCRCRLGVGRLAASLKVLVLFKALD
jgi:hypothetical protein